MHLLHEEFADFGIKLLNQERWIQKSWKLVKTICV